MLDLSGVDASTDFKGEFPVTITKAEERLSKSNNVYWSLEFTVFGEKFKGRKIIESFVISNDIAKQRLAQLVDAIGMPRTNLTPNAFQNKQCLAKVVPNKDDEYSKIALFKKYEKPSELPV